MNIRPVIVIVLFFLFVGAVSAETFMPEEGLFAFREVEIIKINDVNFTIPTDFEEIASNDTFREFEFENEKINISVVDNGTVEKVNSNNTTVKSGKTMLGSVNGYLVDMNGTFTFSYHEDEKLVVISSKDMSLMMGVMGKD